MLFRVCLGTPWPGPGQHGRAWDINSGRGRFQVLTVKSQYGRKLKRTMDK